MNDYQGVLNSKKVFWKDQSSVTCGRQEFSGIPFIVLGQKVMDCQFGKDRHLKAKDFFVECLTLLAYFTLKLNMGKRFQGKKDRKSIYSQHNVIPSMANKDAKRFFEEEPGQSESYCEKVLVKEAMICILQKVTGEDYVTTERELQKTEGRKLIAVHKLMFNYLANERSDFCTLHKRGKTD